MKNGICGFPSSGIRLGIFRCTLSRGKLLTFLGLRAAFAGRVALTACTGCTAVTDRRQGRSIP